MGKKKTTRHQASLCRGGRFDLRTSTATARQYTAKQWTGHGGISVRTEDEDVEDQHDEAEEAADAGGVVVEGAAGRLDGRGAGECRKAELEEDVGEGMHGVWTLDSDVVQEVPCLRRVWI